jgi:hypothetical protein
MLGIDLSVAAHGRVAWAELVELLALPPAEGFPLPLRGSNLGTTSVDVFLDVRMSGLVAKDYGLQEKDVLVPTAGAGMPATGGTTAKAMLRFVAEHRFPKPPELWGFALGPLVRLEFFAIFADEAAASAALSTAEPGKKLDVIIRAEVSARLPPLPELSFLSLRSGDTSGLVTLRVEARAGTDATFGLSAEVVNLAMLDIAIPGLSQDGPALSLALASVRAELSVTVSEGGGTMTTLEAKGLGRAHFRPRVDVDAPSTAPLAALFASAGEQDLTLDADATLTLRGTLAKQNNLILDCELEGARVALDVYPVVARLLQGVASPPRAASPADVDCTPRATFGFVLRGFTVGFAGEPWFDLRAAAIALGVEIPGYLRLSTRELRFGLGSPDPEGHVAVRLPLRFPQVTRREFDTVVAPFVQRVRTTSPGDPDDPRTRYLQLLDLYFTLIEATTVAVPGTGAGLLVGVQDASGTWSVRLRDPTLPEDDLPLRLASGTTRKRDLQGELQDTGDLLIALRAEGVWIPLVVDPCLVVKDFAVALSLRGGSRGPSWSGTAAIGGFVGPLAELEKVSLTLGISADLLYFSLDVRGGVTVTVPPLFPGWESGTITVAKAMFGFGYPKRSLAFAFAGELCLPSQLVDALDTSGETTTAGLGVRLPAQSKLAFQFELMPIVIGKVIIPLPMFTFAWDLRKDGAPGIVSTKGCEPSWDGLQLILAPPGGPVLQRYSLELISYCPLLGGLLACSNSRFQGDIQLGSPTDGLTVIVDDLFWAYGIDNQLSLALAPINEVPFFRNVCVNVRMAGFGLRFDLQRPIPTFSPLAIFEALGLLADPLEYQVAPRGELADMVRATLQDAAITLPAEVLALFPDASEALRRELEWTINLGTLIRLVQVVARVAKPLAAEGWHALSEARAPDEFAAKLLAAAPRPDPRKLAAELLDALPPALRRVSLRARFGELDAEVTLILADLDAVRLDLARAVSPQPSPGPSTAVPTEHWSGRVRFRPSPDALPSLDGPGAGAQLLFGAEVDGVSLDDVEAAAAAGLSTVSSSSHASPFSRRRTCGSWASSRARGDSTR